MKKIRVMFLKYNAYESDAINPNDLADRMSNDINHKLKENFIRVEDVLNVSMNAYLGFIEIVYIERRD